MKCYISLDGAILLTYIDGLLQDIIIQTDDLVLFDGLKHSITLFEEQLDTKQFRKDWRG